MGVKGIEMSSLYGKVFNKTISLIIESSCEKLFITRTFIQASSVMNVCDAFSRTKRVEMDVINDNKTLIKTGDVIPYLTSYQTE